MKATDFIKKHGLKHAKEQCAVHGWKNTSWWIQVKNLIQSHELVEKWQGLEAVKIKIDILLAFGLVTQAIQLQKAVADVEACQERAETK